MKVAFIGAGNVAWHLAQALAAGGHHVTAIYSRSEGQREELANLLPEARPVSSLAELATLPLEAILIAVPDAALSLVAQQLKVRPGTIVAHTSGSQPITALEKIAGARAGVFYPLQTFSKAKPVQIKEVPLLVEAQDEQTRQQLEQLALSISNQVLRVDSYSRKQLHLAAVFACNFTNHLLGISQKLLSEADLPTTLLQPLIQETISKAQQNPPFQVQTGPAIRHDENVIAEHLQMLAADEHYRKIYQLITQSIQATIV